MRAVACRCRRQITCARPNWCGHFAKPGTCRQSTLPQHSVDGRCIISFASCIPHPEQSRGQDRYYIMAFHASGLPVSLRMPLILHREFSLTSKRTSQRRLRICGRQLRTRCWSLGKALPTPLQVRTTDLPLLHLRISLRRRRILRMSRRTPRAMIRKIR